VKVYIYWTSQTSIHYMFAWSASSVTIRKHLFFAFVAFASQFFPLRLRHQRSANKIRPDGAPSFTGILPNDN